jgi:hypothetical protein
MLVDMKRLFLGLSLLAAMLLPGTALAAGQFPPETALGSIGLEGIISSAAPTQGPTITTPSNGASFNTIPITVAGLCPGKLLIKVFDNNVFMGSTLCTNGSYRLQINLFSGQNQLVARDYDALDQAGPDSNTVTVTFNDAQFAEFGTHVQLTSDYAERGAPPNQELDWPVNISNGTAPYAISTDWGDGSPTDLMSVAAPGGLTLKHTYKAAGVYKMIVKATDKNGGTAYLQLVAVSTGAITSNSTQGGKNGSGLIVTKVLWWPAVAMLPLIFGAFWVGRRHELYSLRKQLEKSRDQEQA